VLGDAGEGAMMAGGTARAWAQGGTIFGATMMLIIGVFQVLEGIAAIAKNRFFVVASNYVYNVDTRTWGWIHLILGAVVILTGFYLFTGSAWARGLGIALAVLSAIANFLFLPYYPIWALVLIAMDVFVIWSLATTSLRDAVGDTRANYGMSGAEDSESYGAHAAARTPTEGQRPTEGQPTEGQRWPAANQPGARNQPDRYSDQQPPASPAGLQEPTANPQSGANPQSAANPQSPATPQPAATPQSAANPRPGKPES
jgi:hypothetical protein